MAIRDDLDRFFNEVERRAYKTALYSVHDQHEALDIVQNAMLKLFENYGGRPPGEWPMLFQRILQNAILDHHRRHRVRDFWIRLMSPLRDPEADEATESLEGLAVADERPHFADPATSATANRTMQAIEAAIAELPLRQRQAFLLRYWEEMEVSEAARIMGCSEGSVKTHCHRAINALAKKLRSKGIEP